MREMGEMGEMREMRERDEIDEKDEILPTFAIHNKTLKGKAFLRNGSSLVKTDNINPSRQRNPVWLCARDLVA